jgi:glycosyltransferase involved in cell wall biosynthesis
MEQNKELSIVVPVFNEELNISPFLARIIPAIGGLNINYEIIFCLDPSTDNSYKIIKNFCHVNENIKLITFSRRFGQPAATMAGIAFSKGKFCVVIDVDLQDQPELVPVLYNKALDGFDVVYATRRSRSGETWLKRVISFMGYKLIGSMSELSIPRNTGDFRIISRRVIDSLLNFKESNAFLRGYVAFIGFNQTFIEYDRDSRFAGDGNYNRYFGSLKIGLNGLVSFSRKPLQVMSVLGFGMSFLSFLISIFYFISHFYGSSYPLGLTTIVLVVTFFAGIQLLAIGILGEYIGRIYDDVKGRPLYIVDELINIS